MKLMNIAHAFRVILIVFVVWRVLLFIPLLVGQSIPYRQNNSFTNMWHFKSPYSPVSSELLYPWANFDGVHYLSIAGEGYSYTSRFFPLYPLIIRMASAPFSSELFGAAQFFVGLLVSNVALLLSLFVLYKLFLLDYPQAQSLLILGLLLCFPTAFFFGSIYSESLFLLCSALSLYFSRKNNWGLAAIFGFLTTLTRLVGIGILFALLVEYAQQRKERKLPKSIAFLGIIPLGPLMFSYFNYLKWGNPLQFLQEHSTLGNSRSSQMLVLPLQTMFRYFKIFFSLPVSQYEWWIALLELMLFVFGIYLFFVAWRNKVRLSYLMFGLFCFLIPAFSGTFTGLPRYIAPLFPIYIAMSFIKSKTAKVLLMIFGLLLQFLLLLLFSRGYFVA